MPDASASDSAIDTLHRDVEFGEEDQARSVDRTRVLAARHRGRRLPLLWLLIGPGILAMLGENDGPSMLSYATTGATYGAGFFLPFIVLTFGAATIIQEMAMRVGAVTHRGYGELVFQRFGAFWGWVGATDLLVTNVITLVTEFIAIRVGMSFFHVPSLVSVGLGVGLVVVSVSGRRYWHWERIALSLAGFNFLFVVAALMQPVDGAAVATAFATWTPLPRGSVNVFLLIMASNIGATVTPWMIFFQQSASVDKGMTPRDLRQGRIDTFAGAGLAAIAGCGALLATATLFTHHATVGGDAGTGFADALRPIAGFPVAAIFSLGLVEAGALAILTISASTAYAVGEVLGGAHSFNRRLRDAPGFYAVAIGSACFAAGVTLLPGAPLLQITLNANLLATILMPAALVFLLILANDRDIMGPRVNGRVVNLLAVVVTAVIVFAGTAAVVVGFLSAIHVIPVGT